MSNQYMREDYSGKTFGELTLIEYIGGGKYKCKCSCGKYKEARTGDLKKGRVKSCGHLKRSRQLDIVGSKFNKLTVMKRVGKNERGDYLFLCACECGKERVLVGKEVKRGKIKSCGDKIHNIEAVRKANTTHGDTGKRLYEIYRNMMDRCYNKNNIAYKDYGGRGIRVYEGWTGEGGYERFKEWAMDSRYEDNLTIDRKNVNGDYTPDNCRWATTKQQARNKRRTLYATIGKETKPVAQWCEEKGLKYQSVWRRIRIYNYSPEKALTYRIERIKK